MNEKKWLIRTFDKKILGPVSRDKLIRLLRDNKLSESDEICPGNHFWVYAKEKKIVSKILEAPEILNNSTRLESLNPDENISEVSKELHNGEEEKKK
jgi:hypothetical protein